MPKPIQERLDQERMGIFREMEYVSIGDKYPAARPKKFKPDPGVKRFEVPFDKEKCGLQDGYFSKTFDRVMAKEAYHDPVAARRKHRNKEAKKAIGGAFVPSHPAKLGSGVGSHFGTLGGKVPHFSPVLRPGQKVVKEKPNFAVPPPPVGSGFGYSNVLIGKVPEHKADPLDAQLMKRRKEAREHREKLKARGGGPFVSSCAPKSTFEAYPGRKGPGGSIYREDKKVTVKATPFLPTSPAKDPAGCKAGMFTKFPEHKKEPYIKPPVLRDLRSKIRPKNCPLTFHGVPGVKTTRTTSILEQNVTRRIHGQNYKEGDRVMAEAAPPKECVPLVTIEV